MKNPTAPDTRVPVTILTGFLGSGKTTLLNRILSEQHGRRIAVIENEYGEIGIDHELVINAEEEIFEMNNGCICCTVRGDLIRILGNLARRRDRFDYVLIETTGLADPGPVAQTFFLDDEVKAQFRLDGIVTLVDARHVAQHLDSSSECQQQIAFADRLILNKTDLASPDQLAHLETRLKAMNALARLRATQQAAVPIGEVLDVRAFDLETKLAVDGDFLKEELPFEWSGELALEPGLTDLVFQPGPDPLMAVAVLPLASKTDAARDNARRQAVALFGTAGTTLRPGSELTPTARLWKLVFHDETNVFRLRVDRPGAYRFFTQHRPAEFALEFRRDGRTLEPGAAVEHAAAHTHDATVSSVGIRQDGALDLKRLEQWLGELLQTRGADIFRMKGVLCIQGEPCRFVFQGVHMLFDGRPDRPWRADEPRTNQLVFIGRNLHRETLNAGFRRCFA